MTGLVAFAREQLGLVLHAGQVDVLDGWVTSGKRKALLCLGRRSGKTLMAAVVAIANAVLEDLTAYLRPGETRFILVVATRLDQAREFIRVARELLDDAPDPDLVALVDRDASSLDEIVFRTGVVIRALPCSSRSVRGLAASLVVLDEFAHFTTTEEGYQAARTVWRALVPSVAQFKQHGRVMVISTPLWPQGLFYDLFKAGESGADPELFVTRRPTWEVNGEISRESLDGEFVADPEGAASEYGAEFRDGVGAFLNAVDVYECVQKGRRELPPLPGVRYAAACDPAFARMGDQFTFAIGHRAGDGEEATIVLDRVDAWRGRSAPLNSDLVMDEIAGSCRQYGLSDVVSDQFALVPLQDGFRRRGITLQGQPLHSELKADIFGSLKRCINLRRVELPDDPELIAELLHLEVRPTAGGKPRIAASGSGRDDKAMSVATVVHRLTFRADSYVTAMDYFESHADDEQKKLADEYLRQINAVDVDAYVHGNADNPTLAAAMRTNPGGP